MSLTLAQGAVRLSDHLLIGLTSRGFVLPAGRDGDVWHLHSADLELLAALAREPGLDPGELASIAGSGEDGDAERLEKTLAELDRRGVIGPAVTPPMREPYPGEPLASSPPVETDGPVQVPTPITVQVIAGGYRWFDPTTGRCTDLSVGESIAVGAFVVARTVDEGHAHLVKVLGDGAPDASTVRRALGAARELGLLVPAGSGTAAAKVNATTERLRREELERNRAVFREVAKDDDARRQRAATGLTAVVPVAYPAHLPPFSLGLIISYAQAHKGGILARQYDLEPRWQVRKENLDRVLAETGPGIFLFSHYVWSTGRQLEVAALLKEKSPESLTIHGGPSVPRHPDELAAWMQANPQVDIAVRNEGEVTTAEILELLEGRIVGRQHELPALLAGIKGITYRDGDRLVRTENHDRIADLDLIPSPYLTGLFAPWERAGTTYMILETNRGCPYGCTFCDWGQVTMSRIRKFDLDRVLDEIEWAGRARATRIQVADANFGIFPRDVEIAQRIADVRARTGYPKEVFLCFAKNTMKHITQVVRILVEAGVITTGSVSLQTTDPDTLEAVARQNIKTEKYWELASVFRELKLPLMIDLMLGLPGSTPASFDNDLQHCVDIEVQPRAYRTELLVNSPMNDPEYRERYQIRTEDVFTEGFDIRSAPRWRKLVLSTSTYTAEEMRAVIRHSDSFAILENYGLARHLTRWARQTSGIREVELYRRIDQIAVERPDRYPVLHWVLETLHGHSAVPLRWQFFYDDLCRLLVDELGLPDGSGLETVRRVQEVLMPARGRSFPDTVDLPHDYATWYGLMMTAKERGEFDWYDRIPALESFGPGSLTVDDPDGLCDAAIGSNVDAWCGDNWELDSAVCRTALKFRRL